MRSLEFDACRTILVLSQSLEYRLAFYLLQKIAIRDEEIQAEPSAHTRSAPSRPLQTRPRNALSLPPYHVIGSVLSHVDGGCPRTTSALREWQ